MCWGRCSAHPGTAASAAHWPWELPGAAALAQGRLQSAWNRKPSDTIFVSFFPPTAADDTLLLE